MNFIRKTVSKIPFRENQKDFSDLSYCRKHVRLCGLVNRPNLCPICKSRPVFDLHNIDGLYTDDIKSWIWLCRKCHKNLNKISIKCYNIGDDSRTTK